MIWKHARLNTTNIDGDRRSAISMAQSRLAILAATFVVAYLLIMIRMVDLSIVQGVIIPDDPIDVVMEQEQALKALAKRRGDIYDRNGFLIATTLKTPSLYADPSLVLEPDSLLADLKDIIPDLDEDHAKDVLHAENRFGWLKRHITPEQQEKILALGDPSLGFKYEYKRVYPQKSLFAHLLGYTDRDGLGLSGIERGYDDVLGAGKDVHLTVDLRLQHLVRREVQKAMDDFSGKAGVGLIMDAKTGEILAGTSLPDYDLNLAGHASSNSKFNRLTLGVYELGSMFKIFSTAALLELNEVPLSYTFDARTPIKIGRFTINDYHAQKRIMTVPEVFMHSSNIGSAMMGEMIGGDNLKNFYADLGLLNPMRFEIREVGYPLVPNPWRKVNTYTASYGHGLATTPLQMSAAVATIVSDGMLVSPTLVKRDTQNPLSEVRLVSADTSEKMRKLLRLVVTKGTGKKADAKGFAVGGKTGTAEKSVNGRYDKNLLISSFVGAFPMNNPKYVVMVMVDEPKPNSKSYGYATAGWVAAPAIKRIVLSMASVLGLPADKYEPSKDISNSLLPFLKEEKEGRKKLVSY